MRMKLNPELQTKIKHQQSKLFEHYSKILMIRTDFHWSDNTDRYKYGDEHQFSFELSMAMLRISEDPSVIGYCWALEEGLDRGLHAHAILYVNGQQHRKKWPFYIEQERLWDEVTQGEGHVHRCIDNRGYRYSIRYPIHHSDTRGQKAMRYVANYLAKDEQKPFGLVYGISCLPKSDNQVSGRPRSRYR